ncbi:MAG: hypothetical protein UT37_C0002G0023 [Parcubacteria group bacterium GW2011_GWA2_39_18]|nr:MAG: hypothetical protein UT37_C0002G0023 [Parcubacteria group bacterium GW2011_GWA2_39_18]
MKSLAAGWFSKLKTWFLKDLDLKDGSSRTDFLFFWATIVFSALWIAMETLEAFEFTTPGHEATWEVTFIWLSVMGVYSTHKGMARWHGVRLDGQKWGKTFGVATLLYGFFLYFLYTIIPSMVIPKQLFFGLTGLMTVVLGWETAKFFHNKNNGNEHSATKESGSKPKSTE